MAHPFQSHHSSTPETRYVLSNIQNILLSYPGLSLVNKSCAQSQQNNNAASVQSLATALHNNRDSATSNFLQGVHVHRAA